MNVTDIVCVSFGSILNVLTFFLGVAVGVTMVRNRKDSDHDSHRYEDEGFQYYDRQG
jgi:hypothetical protein